MRLSDHWERWRLFPGHLLRSRREPALATPEGTPSALRRRHARADEAGVGLTLTISRTGAVLTLIAFTLGLFVAAQIQTTQLQAMLTTETQTETAANTIRRLEQEQADLKKAIGEARARLAREQQAQASQRTVFAQLNEAIESEKLAAGLVPLKGRGIRVVLDDSAVTKVPQKDDPSLYIVHEYQIRDVVNVLWLAGAEAISINGERIVASTSVYCVGSTILVNDTRLSPPYEILAIGDPVALESALNDPTRLRQLRARVKSYGVQFIVGQQREVRLPAYNGTLTIRHAVAVGSGSAGGGQAPAAETPRQ